jgi:hypothetical protein
MAKIVEATRLTTAQKISGEQRDIAGLEQEIASLKAAQFEHLGDDTPDRALQIGERIVAAERGLQIRRERLTAFRTRARKERIQSREKAKAAALVELERRLGVEAAAAGKLDEALADLQAALKDYAAVHRATLATWHPDFPPSKFFSAELNVYHRIGSALGIPVAVASVRLPEIADRVGSFAEPAARLAAEVVETVKNWPLPDPPDDDDDTDAPDSPTAAAPVVPAPELHKPAGAMETLATA